MKKTSDQFSFPNGYYIRQDLSRRWPGRPRVVQIGFPVFARFRTFAACSRHDLRSHRPLPGGSQQLATNPTRPKIEGLAHLFLKVEDLLVAEVEVTKTQRIDVNLRPTGLAELGLHLLEVGDPYVGGVDRERCVRGP